MPHSKGRSLLALELIALIGAPEQLQNPFRPVGHQVTLYHSAGSSNYG
jgi:hypothetical protein